MQSRGENLLSKMFKFLSVRLTSPLPLERRVKYTDAQRLLTLFAKRMKTLLVDPDKCHYLHG